MTVLVGVLAIVGLVLLMTVVKSLGSGRGILGRISVGTFFTGLAIFLTVFADVNGNAWDIPALIALIYLPTFWEWNADTLLANGGQATGQSHF